MRQVHYDLLAVPEDTYELKGQTESFTLRTNASWTVAVTAGNTTLAKLDKTSGEAATSGEQFYFTLANDPDGEITQRTMTLTFTYTGEDGRSATRDVVINAAPARGLKDVEAANSYILEPDGEGVAIPLSWANGSPYGELIGAGDDVTVKVLWLDTDRGIASNSVISGYQLKGNGSAGTIEVYPGSQEGNALIAAIVDNEIVWSWHIWVTGYDIEGTTFSTAEHTWMHINLGALDNTPGSTASYGLFYQLGRKDPFPTVVSLSNATQRPLWDETGQNRVYMEVSPTTVPDNIRNAMKHPTTFFQGISGNNNDWITSNNSVKDDYLWNSASNGKTHYDPCPGGWRMPYKGDSGPFVSLGFTSTLESSSGRLFADSQSYWPMTGAITTTGVYNVSSSLNGYYWSGAVESGGNLSGRYLLRTSGGAELYGSLQRSYGANVRCVKE
ncbi:MAG: hypothetical protein LUE10_06415 [Alistipes sp.]|nr:hypothetical protein [Alistipes sp.]